MVFLFVYNVYTSKDKLVMLPVNAVVYGLASSSVLASCASIIRVIIRQTAGQYTSNCTRGFYPFAQWAQLAPSKKWGIIIS